MPRDRQKTQRSVERISSPPELQENHAQDLRLAETSRADGATLQRLRATGLPMNTDAVDSFHVEEAGERWLHLRWSLSQKTLARAESAMGREGHRSTRMLRLHSIEQGESGPPSKELLQQIDVPLDAAEWFLKVPTSAPAWLVEYGAAFGQNRFFSMLHSSPILLSTHRASQRQTEQLLAKTTLLDSLDAGHPPPLTLQGTFVLQGVTSPRARVLVDDRDVAVEPQSGQFHWQLPLSNGRVVVPINVTQSGQVRRALLAVETNFHLLDPEPAGED
ncbi:DUF4912 domain-containing protein [Planctomicrobium piriforme]|uniref:Uncharacterized protein n=1 Tax=Planctomicrobium piriforme TaxID=1576369 RepID=A0A1I3S5P8_9PLAN|nr:DUF4912 domain-containing protein [Planctomicrobium piriforme]SFJ53710.1 protein of unknown function [Planctomicrobium piriforme]